MHTMDLGGAQADLGGAQASLGGARTARDCIKSGEHSQPHSTTGLRASKSRGTLLNMV